MTVVWYRIGSHIYAVFYDERTYNLVKATQHLLYLHPYNLPIPIPEHFNITRLSKAHAKVVAKAFQT